MKIKKFYKSLIILPFLIILVIGILFYCTWYKFLNTPIIAPGQQIVFVFPQGASIFELTNFLHKNANLKNPKYFYWLAKMNGALDQLKAGEYEFSGGFLPQQILNKVRNGKVIQHKITLIEGWNFTHICEALNTAPRLNHTLAVNPQTLMQKLKSNYKNPEGLFFPDTYMYTMGTSDFVILKNAYNEMQKNLDKAWQQRAQNLPYKNAYEALIVASMIEKEAKLDSERSIIASVILNRIHKKMYLQIDPTVIYALGNDFKGKLTDADLDIASPYNTYKYKGLPPTPIAMPSEQSIYAALHPANTDYYYYVSKGDGSHAFSKTLKGHNLKVKEYLK